MHVADNIGICRLIQQIKFIATFQGRGWARGGQAVNVDCKETTMCVGPHSHSFLADEQVTLPLRIQANIPVNIYYTSLSTTGSVRVYAQSARRRLT